jgi:3-oxoadipate enol-lactonase
VLELLDALDLERVHFCGLSLGGMVGQWLAVRAPERIDRLILANTSAYMGPPDSWQARIAGVFAQGMEPLAQASINRWFTPDFAERAPEAVAIIQSMLLATSPIGYAGCCAAIRDMDQRATAALITAPTLVISGAHDPATPPPHALQLVQSIADCQHISLEAAHLSNVEAPVAFTSSLVDFLNQTKAAGQ